MGRCDFSFLHGSDPCFRLREISSSGIWECHSDHFHSSSLLNFFIFVTGCLKEDFLIWWGRGYTQRRQLWNHLNCSVGHFQNVYLSFNDSLQRMDDLNFSTWQLSTYDVLSVPVMENLEIGSPLHANVYWIDGGWVDGGWWADGWMVDAQLMHGGWMDGQMEEWRTDAMQS